MRHARWVSALIALLASGCAIAHERCDDWRAVAARADACSAGVLPPVDSPSDVTCVTEDELASGGVVAGYDECVAFLDEHADTCTALPLDDPRTEACTYGAVAGWEPTAEPDACARWRRAARSHAVCDPEVFAFVPDAPCVSDAELAARGRFASVAACADFLLATAYPCDVPLGEDRFACGPDRVLAAP